MQIIAQCPFCGKSRLFDASVADRRVRCEKCRRLFKVPSLNEVPKAVKVIKNARGNTYVDEDGKVYG